MGALIGEYTIGYNSNGNTNQHVLAAAENAQSNLIGEYTRYTKLYKGYTRVYKNYTEQSRHDSSGAH